MDMTLFRARVLELFNYDPRSGMLFWKVSPSNRVKVGQEAGSISSDGYRYVRIDSKLYLTHRLIFLIEHGYLPEFIDHKDGDRLNNRIENLREASRSENNRNASKKSNNTSGIVGVHLHKATKKWQALCVDRNGKQTYLGLFTDIQVPAALSSFIISFSVVRERSIVLDLSFSLISILAESPLRGTSEPPQLMTAL